MTVLNLFECFKNQCCTKWCASHSMKGEFIDFFLFYFYSWIERINDNMNNFNHFLHLIFHYIRRYRLFFPQNVLSMKCVFVALLHYIVYVVLKFKINESLNDLIRTSFENDKRTEWLHSFILYFLQNRYCCTMNLFVTLKEEWKNKKTKQKRNRSLHTHN